MSPKALLVARVVVGGTFVIAGLPKIADPAAFASAIANYRLLPAAAVGFSAATLPWIELLAGGMLMAGWMARGSALLLGVASLVFAGALSSALWRGLDVSCGCFTLRPDATAAGWGHVAFDLVLAGLAFLVLIRGRD